MHKLVFIKIMHERDIEITSKIHVVVYCILCCVNYMYFVSMLREQPHALHAVFNCTFIIIDSVCILCSNNHLIDCESYPTLHGVRSGCLLH